MSIYMARLPVYQTSGLPNIEPDTLSCVGARSEYTSPIWPFETLLTNILLPEVL